MDNRELYHYGILGMKWGRRRYQNSDGSLTEAGRKRYDRDVSSLSNKKQKAYKVDANKWVKEDLERSRRVVDETSQLTSKLKNVTDSSAKKRTKTKMDLSSMTDEQMRKEINRALLERQYNDMFAPQKVSRGKAYASKILEGTAATLGIASSALGIALAIKELRG